MSEFNFGLAAAAIDAIRNNPGQHVQEKWRCDTGMCMAGWVGAVMGLEWASQHPLNPMYKYVVLPVGFEIQTRDEHLVRLDPVTGERIMHISDLAQLVLGLDDNEALMMFSATNTAEDLEEYMKILGSDDDPDSKKERMREVYKRSIKNYNQRKAEEDE